MNPLGFYSQPEHGRPFCAASSRLNPGIPKITHQKEEAPPLSPISFLLASSRLNYTALCLSVGDTVRRSDKEEEREGQSHIKKRDGVERLSQSEHRVRERVKMTMKDAEKLSRLHKMMSVLLFQLNLICML